MANKADATKLLRDVPKSAFCVHPQGTYAYFIGSLIMRIDLATGQRTNISELSRPKFFQLKNCYAGHHAIFRSPELFIYSLYIDWEGTKKLFVVLWSVNDDSMVVRDERYTGIDVADGSYYNFLQVAEGQFLVVSYYWTDSETIFDAAQIHINESGDITLTVVARKRSLKGLRRAPFFHDEFIYWVPANHTMSKLLKASLIYEQTVKIIVKNKIVDLPSISYSTSMSIVIGDYLFCYAYNEKKNFGMLLKLDLKEKYWRRVTVKADGHKIIDGVQMKYSENGFLYLTGTCESKACLEKTHLFIVDLRTELKDTFPRWEKKADANRANSGPEPKVSELSNKVDQLQPNRDVASKNLEDQQRNKNEKKMWTPVNFIKQKELGRGAFGVVYKCFDKQAQRLFVTKETFSQGNDALETAKNEINRLKEINHPRVIEYYGFQMNGNAIIIFMEYMPAGSLRQIINKFGLIEETASIAYTDQILDGLEYIHKIGIVHSDLKCDNILNDGRGNIKLGDFGIAVQKMLNGANHSYFRSDIKGGGTPYYLAPEVMKGEGCSRRSDIWSLGCTIVEMLTGLPPYRNMPFLEFMTGLGNKTLSYNPNELVPNVSDRMKKFLSYLLQIDAEKRPRSAIETLQIFKTLF